MTDVDKLAKDMKNKYAIRASDEFRKRRIFKIPAALVFEALRLQGLVPETAVYLDAHCDHYEETFAIKCFDDSFPEVMENHPCPIEQMGLQADDDKDNEFGLRFYVI